MDGAVVVREKKLGTKTHENSRGIFCHSVKRFGKNFLKTLAVFIFGKVELGALEEACLLVFLKVREEFAHQKIARDEFPPEFAAQSGSDFIAETAHLARYCDDRHKGGAPFISSGG